MLASITALGLHLVEEVATGFRRRFPLGEMPPELFVTINVIVYAFSLSTFVRSLGDEPTAVPLAWVGSRVAPLNVVGHTGFMLAGAADGRRGH